MELPDNLAEALRTLSGAVDLLEAAAERRVRAEAARADLETELRVMADDRARLAGELDASLAHADDLSAANAEAGKRLDRISETVRAMLATASPSPSAPPAPPLPESQP